MPARIFSSTKKIYRIRAKQILRFVDKRPLSSFFVVLGILFILIFAGSYIRKPKEQPAEAELKPKEVSVYSVGSLPKITLQAQVKKSGLVKIVAQTPAIVSKINVSEGQKVDRGTTLISLSTNYQGGNAQAIQSQIANKQYQNAVDTYPVQIDLLNKQREIAKKTDENADKLRDITNQSVSETQSAVNLNNEILAGIDANIASFLATNVGGSNDALILQAKELKSQFVSANNQLNASLRNSQYQASGDNPPANLSNLQKDIALFQLDLQEKSLGLNKDISQLQLRLAQVMAAQMFPAAPFSGVVERLDVRVGQLVNPGTVLLTFSGNNSELTAVAQVPANIARVISAIEPSDFEVDGRVYQTVPMYISTEATEGQLYSVIFTLDQEISAALVDSGFVNIHTPVGISSAEDGALVPIDAVHQTQDATYIFVVSADQAQSKAVTLGGLQGKFVKVVSGLSREDEVILSRNIVNGDKIIVKK